MFSRNRLPNDRDHPNGRNGSLLTLGPAAPAGDVTLVVAVDAAGRVVELEVAGRRHAHHVDVLEQGRKRGKYINGVSAFIIAARMTDRHEESLPAVKRNELHIQRKQCRQSAGKRGGNSKLH